MSPADITACARTIEPYLRGGLTHENGLTVPPAVLDGENLVVSEPVGSTAVVGTGWGDFNRDGVDDEVITTVDGIFVVPGPVAPYADPKSAGVRLAHTILELNPGMPRAIGDQDGDGVADVAFDGRLTSGRELLAKPPGSTIDVPKPFATVPYLSGALRLDPGEPPALVQFIGDVPSIPTGQDLPIEIKLGLTDPICLVTGNSGVDPSLGGPHLTSGGGSIDIRANLVDGHRIVEFSYDNRNDLRYYRWDLDA